MGTGGVMCGIGTAQGIKSTAKYPLGCVFEHTFFQNMVDSGNTYQQ